MRRKAPIARSGDTTEDIRKDLTQEQLAGIGEVAMAWNEIEFLLDVIAGSLALAPALWLNVASRLVFDAKRDLALDMASDALLPAATINALELLSGDLATYKNYRDAVVHARVFSKKAGIGMVVKRGAEIYESLLTKEALNALYDHLVLLRQEIKALVQVYYAISRTGGAGMRVADGPDKQRREREFLRWTNQAQGHRTSRLSLGPLPKFPD